MTEEKNVKFWLSRKFWYTVMAAAIFLALSLTGTVEFTNEQVMTFILGLVGITVGGHTLTNIGALVAQAVVERGKVTASGDTSTKSPTDDTDAEEAPDEA